jgi:Tfp pilus assembly protein PilZ
MINLSSKRTYKEGDMIIREGSYCNKIYIILSGFIELNKTINKKKYTICYLKKGDTLGELGFFTKNRYPVSAFAADDVVIGIIDKRQLYSQFMKLSKEMRSVVVSMANGYLNLLDNMDDFSYKKNHRQKIVSLTYRDRKSFFRAYTDYSSRGGLFIKTKQPLRENEEILLKLKLPGISNPLSIGSEVAWAIESNKNNGNLPTGMFVLFREIPRRDGEILKTFVQGGLDSEIMKNQIINTTTLTITKEPQRVVK